MNRNNHFDAIIIGSGAGGAAAAYGLAQSGARILLLEKGGSLPLDGSTLDVARVVRDGEFLSREPWQDGLGNALRPEEHFNLGGKTKWYGAALLRFSPEEFYGDSAEGLRDWPIGYEDLAPYYDQAEKLLDVRTFACEPDLRGILTRLSQKDPRWHSASLPLALIQDVTNHPWEAQHFDGFASALGCKSDAQTAFLSRLQSLSNFQMQIDSEVVALLQGNDRRRVSGVRLRGGEEFFADSIVLSAGALHSPRLLAGYLAQSGLASVLPCARNVGRNLKLHLLTAMVSVSLSKKNDLLRKTMFTTHRAFARSSVQPLGFDSELISTLVPSFIPRGIARLIGRRAYGFFLQTEDGSHLDNRVDATDTPTLDYDGSRIGSASVEHRRFTHALQRALLRCGYISLTQKISVNGTAHACGTLVAGDDPNTSVVDSKGAVHGIAGLYVADGSVLCRSSRVNPSLTIYAWALRVADLMGSTAKGRVRAIATQPQEALTP